MNILVDKIYGDFCTQILTAFTTLIHTHKNTTYRKILIRRDTRCCGFRVLFQKVIPHTTTTKNLKYYSYIIIGRQSFDGFARRLTRWQN